MAVDSRRSPAIRPRILIADDHRMLADAYERVLTPACEIVGKVEDGRALLAAADELRPDVVVLDISMPRLNGLDAARLLKEQQPDVQVVVVTMHKDPKIAAQARRAGASAFVTKSAAASELESAVTAVLSGETYLTPLVSGEQVDALLRRDRVRSGSRLTPRQRQVLQLLAEGRVMKQVALELGLSTRTVAHHKYKIMSEQDIDSNAGLIQLAIEEGLIPPPASP